MEKLEQMKECLVGMVEGQIYGNIDKVDTKELGEAIDMIKDLSEAIYYCTITKSMEEGAEKEKDQSKHGMMYYAPRERMMERYPIEYYDPRYRANTGNGMMYAVNNNGSSNNGGNNTRGYSEGMIPRYHDGMPNHIYHEGMMTEPNNYSPMMKDPKEGRSGTRRKMYMEGKGVKEKSKQMQELDMYMQELASDMTEMIQDASPEEKTFLQQKIATLASKIK